MLFTAFCVVLYFVSRFSCIATIQRLLLCVNERNEIQYNPTCTQTRKHCHMWIQMIEEVWKVSFCFCLLMIASASMWTICGSNFSKFKSKNFKCSCVIFSAIWSLKVLYFLCFSNTWWYMCSFNWFKCTNTERFFSAVDGTALNTRTFHIRNMYLNLWENSENSVFILCFHMVPAYWIWALVSKPVCIP